MGEAAPAGAAVGERGERAHVRPLPDISCAPGATAAPGASLCSACIRRALSTPHFRHRLANA